jgi:hypothetical protein
MKMRIGKNGAIELSIGTVVIVVLAMTMLILGLILVKNIFSGTTNIIDIANAQTLNEINKLFGEDKKTVVYPSVSVIEVKQGAKNGNGNGFALGISNKLSGASARNALFSYNVVPVSDVEKDCGISKDKIMELFVAGSNREENIPIATGSPVVRAVLFETNEGDPLCTVKFRADILANGNNYDSVNVFIKFRD